MPADQQANVAHARNDKQDKRPTQHSTSRRRFLNKNSVAIILAIIGAVGGWGTTYLSNYDKIQQGKNLTEQARIWAKLREGHYQWQWAKEGWLGDVSVKKDDTGQLCATVDITKFCTHWGRPVGKVLASEGCGTVSETAEGQPKIILPVIHTPYDDACKALPSKHERLVMVLNPRESYTGSVDYINSTGGTQSGSIGIINWDYQPNMGNSKEK